jgi:hypothetical protein
MRSAGSPESRQKVGGPARDEKKDPCERPKRRTPGLTETIGRRLQRNRTLQGHVEKGQMDWQVWKFPDTGEVLFRICSFSRSAGGGNMLVRIGFRLVGRRERLRLLNLTAERITRLTAESPRPDALREP